ncbi:hypothetical protein SynBIOSU31_02100 [Synechococcus sp. BIOS-U3-1]|nr:hypothetical protein SynBIOSU31_02100 [Synechococcus sp. BIOS-U3-1]
MDLATARSTQLIGNVFPALPKSFFCRPAELVGPELVGCLYGTHVQHAAVPH